MSNTPIADFIGEQIKEGQRGFVFGERHSDVAVIQSLKNENSIMKAKNISTLYVEYMAAEEQELLDKALGGNRRAQKELRALFEGLLGFSHQSAQTRYDILFEAHKNGMRVLGIDPPHSQPQVSHYFVELKSGKMFAGPSEERRLQTSDPYIVNKMKELDDGKPFMVIIGASHTYAKNSQHLQSYETHGLTRSALGGIDTRLTDEAGIPTTSIDMFQKADQQNISIKRANGIDSHFALYSPEDKKSELKEENFALTSLGRLSQLNNYLVYTVSGGQLPPEAMDNAHKAAKLSRHIIDRIIDGQSFDSQEQDMVHLNKLGFLVVQEIEDQNEILGLVTKLENLKDIYNDPTMRELVKAGEKELQEPSAERMWNPNVAIDTSYLKAQWNSATTNVPPVIPEVMQVADPRKDAANETAYKVPVNAP